MVDYSIRAYGATGNGSTDDSAAIQAALNACRAVGGGLVRGEAGNYVTRNVQIPDCVRLVCDGRGSTLFQAGGVDANVFSFVPGSFGGLEHCHVEGYDNPATGTNAIWIPAGVVSAKLLDVVAWGGYSALYIQGIDCDLDDCYFGNSYHGAAVTSNGANWYRRCKIDSNADAIVGGKPSSYYGFMQGSSVNGSQMENHFSESDFSGCYDNSVLITDGNNSSITDFSGCVFSAPIVVQNAFSTTIRGCELGGDVVNNSGQPVIISACTSLGSRTASNCVNGGGNPGVNFV